MMSDGDKRAMSSLANKALTEALEVFAKDVASPVGRQDLEELYEYFLHELHTQSGHLCK